MSGTAADATTLPSDPALTAARGLLDAGQFPEAEAAYRDLLATRAGDADVLTGLGDVLTDAGKPAEAMAVYRQVTEAAPDAPASANAYDGLAALLQDAGDVEGAIAASKKSAALTGDADEVYRCGYTLQQMRRGPDAIEMYDLASRLRPTFAEAHAKVAAHLLATGKTAEAVARYQKAVDGRPDMAELYTNLAFAQHAADLDDSAIKTIRKAIELKPDLPEGHNLLGVIFRDRRRPNEALQSFTKAVQLKPDFAEAYGNLGLTLESVGRIADATSYLERAVQLQPKVPHYHENLGRHRLLRGEWPSGWPELEWRRADPRNPVNRPVALPVWDTAADVSGKTILLRTEQHRSDTILFVRYAKSLADRGARVIVEVEPELAGLIRTVPGVSDTAAYGDPLAGIDLQFPLLSMPLAIFELPDTIVPVGSYLTPDVVKVSQWADKLPSAPPCRVGIVWAPDGEHATDRNKACPPRQLAALAAVLGVRLVALASTTTPPLPESANALDIGSTVLDPSELAAVVANLDLVIGVDSLAVHLAAAMGKPTWVMLPALPEWRWLLDRPNSPWYSTVRLFRPTEVGDWASVTTAVAAELTTFVAGR